MKYFIFLSVLFVSSFSFAARNPSANDKYCGVLAVKMTHPPASCHTCTPVPPQFYLKVKTRILDESDIGHGSVQDAPVDLVVRLAVTRDTSAPDGGDKGVALQRSLLHGLTARGKYCAVGIIGPAKMKDGVADHDLDFSGIYAGEK